MAMEADWSSETNWTITSGSLRDTLTFQSSLSISDDGESTSSDSKSSPLILHPPSPDSDPCEIKINFAKKHELRQVYVRSTARVYEIYFAPNLKSNNEYLCTVRCGVAVRDGQILCSSSIQERASSPDKDLAGESTKSEDDWVEVKVVDSPVMESQTKPCINSAESNQDLFEATAEIDDANPCISVTLRLLSLESKGCVYVDEIFVFGDPVDSADSESQESRNENSSSSSLMAMFLPTLMQLSKTTGHSHLNAVRKEKPFVSEDDLKETHSSDSVIKNQLKGTASTTNPEEVKLKEVKGGWVGSSQLDIHSQVAKIESDHAAVPSQTIKMDSNYIVMPSEIAEMDNNHGAVPCQIAQMKCNHSAVPSKVAIPESSGSDSLGGNVERALEQLVSRMDRLEKICFGFQEKMVMPMSSIEARLQRVEQQLDTLTKKLQHSALPSSYRISAPDASCIESDANSCDNSLDYTVTTENESDKKILHTEELYVSPHDMSDPANTTQLLPGLVVTAPEFPEGEDEEDYEPGHGMDSSNGKGKQWIDGGDEEDNAPGQGMDSSNDKGKQSIDGEDEDNAPGKEMNSSNDKGKWSIDDVLSSALANFLSSSQSLESPKNPKSLTVKAPEFSNEDEEDQGSKNTKSLTVKAPEFSNEDEEDQGSNTEVVKTVLVDVTDTKKFGHIQVLASSNISLESGEEVNRDSNDKHPEKTAQEAEEYDQSCGAEEDRVCVKASILDEHNPRTDFDDNLEDDKNGKINGQGSDEEDRVCVKASILDEHNPKTDFDDNLEDDKNGKINGQGSDDLSSNISEISNELLRNQNPSGDGITQEGPSGGTELTVATEVPKKTFHDNIIENVLGFTIPSSVVDFGSPLLDVEFISQRSPVTAGFLEALLVETLATSSRDPSVKESKNYFPDKEQLENSGDFSVEAQSDLISVDDGEPVNLATDSHFAVDDELYTSVTAPLNFAGVNLPEDHKRKRDHMSTSSLI